jgi:hypothetical protein
VEGGSSERQYVLWVEAEKIPAVAAKVKLGRRRELKQIRGRVSFKL